MGDEVISSYEKKINSKTKLSAVNLLCAFLKQGNKKIRSLQCERI